MLEGWEDYVGPGSASGRGSGGELVPMQSHARRCRIHGPTRECSCHLRAFLELERCIGEAGRLAPAATAHLEQRYRRAQRVRRRGMRFRAGHWQGLAANEEVIIPRWGRSSRGTAPNHDAEHVLLLRWRQGTRLDLAERALSLVAAMFRGEPDLPMDEAA